MTLRMLLGAGTALAVVAALPVGAQVTTKTKVSTEATTKDGMPATTTKVVHVRKHKTHRAKRVLGVKVGHKTKVDKTVKTTTTAANGAQDTTVKTVHK